MTVVRFSGAMIIAGSLGFITVFHGLAIQKLSLFHGRIIGLCKEDNLYPDFPCIGRWYGKGPDNRNSW
jgi:hypothetical protein